MGVEIFCAWTVPRMGSHPEDRGGSPCCAQMRRHFIEMTLSENEARSCYNTMQAFFHSWQGISPNAFVALRLGSAKVERSLPE